MPACRTTSFVAPLREDPSAMRMPISLRRCFKLAVSQIAGKRLTYAELTGKVGEIAF
jgi:hypothetical protein